MGSDKGALEEMSIELDKESFSSTAGGAGGGITAITSVNKVTGAAVSVFKSVVVVDAEESSCGFPSAAASIKSEITSDSSTL
jgi:hypothetical protein